MKKMQVMIYTHKFFKSFINMVGGSYGSFTNFEVDCFESKTVKEFMNFESDRSNEGKFMK